MTGWARDSFFLPYVTTALRDVNRWTFASKRFTGRYSGSVPADINRLTSAMSALNTSAASLIEIKSLSSISDQVNARVTSYMRLGYNVALVLSRALIIHLTSECESDRVYSTPNSPPKHANATMGLAKQYWRY